ncbi:helix-hairpin-helix domain-containing protein [Kribbella sp. NPDC026596]|uniref:helix-hairpin-helix domain-containing protein n=1 Tax=Kribbella sp. NPDC026596 TaxID=3155122 RepID=UPI0034039F63
MSRPGAEPVSRSGDSSSAPRGSRRARGRRLDTRTLVISWIWAILPFVTLGLATPVTFLWAAQRVRSKHYVLATVFYTVLVVLGFIGTNEDVSFAFLRIAWVGGTLHALAVRSSVFRSQSPSEQLTVESAADAARDRRELRRKAREIATKDPGLARELGIGRPDEQHDFDDGGLVDVNSVSADVLAQLRGMTREPAERVVLVRETRGPYSSVEELSVFADLPPGLSDRLAERLLFLRD